MTKHHYVYRSFEEGGRDYIGRRTCNCLPEEDIRYFGSFTDKTFKPTGKVILFVCGTPEEIAEIEIELHDFFDVAVNPQYSNKSKALSTGFDTTGVPVTEEARKKLSEAHTGKTLTEETKKKISEAHNNKTLTEEHKKKLSKAKSGENHPNYGKFGAAHCNSKAIIAIKPEGTELHFGSTREATRELGINNGTLCCKYLKTGKSPIRGKFKGWRFVYENP